MTPRLLPLALGLALLPALATAQPGHMLPNFRPYDQTGVNVFEARKDTALTDGTALRIGAAFTQQFQSLRHDNTATPRTITVSGQPVNINEPIALQAGFNLAQANLMFDAQLARGLRVNLTSYLSSRHHQETWVKGGYLQVDALPFFDSDALDRIMDHVTLKVGHFEVNYGDAHFRRTDGGQAMYNPFVENNIMDAFATEIGTEVYLHQGPFMAMVGVTGGEIQGGVTVPVEAGTANRDARAPSFLGKLAVDRQFSPDLRARLAGSVYTTRSSARNTLFGGDRTGSNYWLVLEPPYTSAGAAVTASTHFTSGRLNPGLTDQITTFQINPFVKWRGLEFFGTFEQASGRAFNETAARNWTQLAGDLVYRFLANEQLFVGGRYNTVSGRLAGLTSDVSVDRFEVGAGWFPMPNLLLKGAYVDQRYRDFPATDIRSGGTFNGVVVEAVLAF